MATFPSITSEYFEDYSATVDDTSPQNDKKNINPKDKETDMKCALLFSVSKPLAVISGAGIAGVAASLELREQGYDVVLVEMRKKFTRHNVINFNVGVQAFLKRHNLVEEFEKSEVAKVGRITKHKYIVIDKAGSVNPLFENDVSGLFLQETFSYKSEELDGLFEKDGIYSAKICDLQEFLVDHARKKGVNIITGERVRFTPYMPEDRKEGVKEVVVNGTTLHPDLFFIAEGAHSTTARDLGLNSKTVVNVCSGENWVFGNMPYDGDETFVVSVIDTSEKVLRIANVIFNARSKVVNIALTIDDEIDLAECKTQMQKIAQRVFEYIFPAVKMRTEELVPLQDPTKVENRIQEQFSKGNVFVLGDTAGNSSPLAGLGGSLGLTLYPYAVSQLLNDLKHCPLNMHKNFNDCLVATVNRWMNKSAAIKTIICTIDGEQQDKGKEVRTVGSEEPIMEGVDQTVQIEELATEKKEETAGNDR